MTVHSAPIPSLKALGQSLFAGHSEGAPWHSPVSKKTIHFYSRGMWAMAAGVQFILDKKNKKEGKVWFPDYFCNEPLAPLRKKEISLHFYPIKNDLSPDWNKLEAERIKYGPPDVFILVHYFGFTNSTERATAFCDEHGSELLEDGAHLLFPVNGVGRNVTIFSPRKLLPVPEGGLLILPENASGWRNNKECKGDLKVVLNWLALRLTQRIMLFLRIPWHRFREVAGKFKKSVVQNSHADYDRLSPNFFTLKLLAVLEKELDLVIEKRRKNYTKLCHIINGVKGVRPLFYSFSASVCPYALPLVVLHGRDSVATRLQNCGIPASSWPDLPPEVLERSDEHKTAVWLQEHILLLPVHQDLSDKQAEYMAFKLRAIFGKGE